MNQVSNRYRNIIAAIDNLLTQLNHEDSFTDNYLRIWRDFYLSEMDYLNKEASDERGEMVIQIGK